MQGFHLTIERSIVRDRESMDALVAASLSIIDAITRKKMLGKKHLK
jgi:hypothetical protein